VTSATTVHHEPTLRRRAIVVLGMHRSGTSALTRVLSFCGASLPKRIMRPRSDNETGFWESACTNAILDEILASAGSVWYDVSNFPRFWIHSDIAKPFKRRLISALDEDFADAGNVNHSEPLRRSSRR
jgi:hypothetical protein